MEISGDGNTHHKLTINYSNPLKYGAWLNAINRDYVRVYVPQGSKLTSNKGSEDKVNTFDELGKTVFEGFMTVKPEGVTEVKVRYRLPFKADKSTLLKLTLQKQPGTDEPQYRISVNGKNIFDKLELREDSDLTLTW